jgi:hypothetical protein
MTMFRTVADALTDDGRYVGSFEHDDLIRRLLGLPIARRYTRGGIFIQHFDAATLGREVAPYFSKFHIRPIRPTVPWVHYLPLAWGVRVSRTLVAMPVMRGLGEILLLRAESPVRPPVEGLHRAGNGLAKALFSWYRQRRGLEPVSDEQKP